MSLFVSAKRLLQRWFGGNRRRPLLFVGLAGAVCLRSAVCLAGDLSLSTVNPATNNNFSASTIGGVYAFGSQAISYNGKTCPQGCLDQNIATNPYIEGVLLGYNWNQIETSDGVYNWSLVDNQVALVGAAGKVATIAIAAGVETPGWVYNEGAQSFNVVWDKAWGFTPCSNQRIPIPWDPVFLAKWQAFVTAFGARYDTNPTVASVKLTGFNSETAELFLPLSINEQINIVGHVCTGPNYVTQWQAAGYTRTLGEYAFNTIESYFAAAFPNTPFEAMKGPADFPPIDANGNILNKTDGEDDQANTDVITAAIATYGQQFVLQNDGLSATWIWKLEESYASQINTGYQMVSSPMGNQLSPAINLALGGGATFLEISVPDIDNPQQTQTIDSAAQQLP